ncbi:MFS general substrate transporter [Calocera cornea HHB12733]|uniref:MFS general substrate transporter n=1 Tax=Calocera cornea HHB12733 TaxID=1353952 RepID=A0A165DK51_9BASI|nr:MFS general substrate transporter [Calocera cornea HHB12733]
MYTRSATEEPLLSPTSIAEPSSAVAPIASLLKAQEYIKKPSTIGLEPQDISSRRRIFIIVFLYCSTFFYGLDSTVVATLATPVSSSFKQLPRAAWLNSAYLLSVACFTPLYGKLADIAGRRIAILTGLSLFSIGSLLCGLSTSMNMLIAARLIQGMGGGGAALCSNVILSDIISLRSRGLFTGIDTVCWSTGAGLGAVYGGILEDTIGWRYAFIFQVPFLGLIMCCLAVSVNYSVPGQQESMKAVLHRLDWGGAGCLVIGLGSLVFSIALKTNEDMPWDHPAVYGTLALALAMLALFWCVETYWAKEPVIRLGLLKHKTRALIAVSIFLTNSAKISLHLFYPMFLQIVRYNSASFAGLHLVPLTFASACGGIAFGWLLRKTGKYYYILIVCACLHMIPTATLIGLSSKSWEFVTWIVLIPQRFGASGYDTGTVVALLATISRADIAVLTSLRFVTFSTGQVIGMALSSAVQQAVVASELQKELVGAGAEGMISSVRRNATAILDLPEEYQAGAIRAYATSLHGVYLLDAVLFFLSLCFISQVKEYSLSEQPTRSEESAEMDTYKLAPTEDEDDDDTAVEDEESVAQTA